MICRYYDRSFAPRFRVQGLAQIKFGKFVRIRRITFRSPRQGPTWTTRSGHANRSREQDMLDKDAYKCLQMRILPANFVRRRCGKGLTAVRNVGGERFAASLKALARSATNASTATSHVPYKSPDEVSQVRSTTPERLSTSCRTWRKAFIKSSIPIRRNPPLRPLATSDQVQRRDLRLRCLSLLSLTPMVPSIGGLHKSSRMSTPWRLSMRSLRGRMTSTRPHCYRCSTTEDWTDKSHRVDP